MGKVEDAHIFAEVLMALAAQRSSKCLDDSPMPRAINPVDTVVRILDMKDTAIAEPVSHC
jgi:hypothetical protein